MYFILANSTDPDKIPPCHLHWRSSHYAVTHVRNKNSYIQGRSPNVVKSYFPYHKELLLKGANSFLYEKFSFGKGSQLVRITD